MITTHAVKYIEEKLKEKTNMPGTDSWGVQMDDGTDASLAGTPGLFVVLYNTQTFKNGVEPNSDKDGIKLLAVSTRIPAGAITQVMEGDKATKKIKIDNVPYTETVSIVTTADKDPNNGYTTANAFAIVEGQTVAANKVVEIINAQGNPDPKYILDTSASSPVNVLFQGSIQNEQTIEPENSFALTNITITFSDVE